MERTGHERVIVYRVGKNDQLGAAHGIVVLGQFCGLLDDAAHQTDGIQIDARLVDATLTDEQTDWSPPLPPE